MKKNTKVQPNKSITLIFGGVLIAFLSASLLVYITSTKIFNLS